MPITTAVRKRVSFGLGPSNRRDENEPLPPTSTRGRMQTTIFSTPQSDERNVIFSLVLVCVSKFLARLIRKVSVKIQKVSNITPFCEQQLLCLVS